MQGDSGKASYVRAQCGISALLIHNSIVGPDVGFLCVFCSQAEVVVAAEQQQA